MRIISLINQKGGVGKTTSTVNLGAAFCRMGHRVLLIDMDPQANLTLHCDVHGVERSIYDTLVSDTSLADVVVSTELAENLDLAPSNIDLSAAESELASLPGRERRLRNALEIFVRELGTGRPKPGPQKKAAEEKAAEAAREPAPEEKPKELSAEMNGATQANHQDSAPKALATGPTSNGVRGDAPKQDEPSGTDAASKAQDTPASENAATDEDAPPTGRLHDEKSPYDFVLIDCPPSLGLLSINALAASHEVLIPLQMEFFALQGMARLMEVLKLMRRRLNPELRVGGIIPCMYDGRTNLSQEVLNEVREYFGELVFKTRIRENIRLAEAPSHGRAIFDYSPSSNGAQDYLALAQEVLTLLEARQPKAATN
ncbi:MAG: ParA family protein [Planctomycetota bacterium]